MVYVIYNRRQLVHERTLRKRAWIDGKRVQQKSLKAELLLAEATLILVGVAKDRSLQYEFRGAGASEFKAAVRYLEMRVAAAAAEQGAQPARAVRRRGTAVPKQPDVARVRRQRGLLRAEIDQLEAEIQSLSTPQAIDLAHAAEQAERSYKERRDAAHEAEKAARDRHRAGRTPSPETPETPLQVSFLPNGKTDVRPLPPTRTPEQIARGEQPAGNTEG